MTPEQVQEFMEAITKAHWNMNFREFCRALALQVSEYNSPWAINKWESFQKLHTALCDFNPTMLAAIVNSLAANTKD